MTTLGLVLSITILNELDAVLLLDTKSWYVFIGTSTIRVPSLVIAISAI